MKTDWNGILNKINVGEDFIYNKTVRRSKRKIT